MLSIFEQRNACTILYPMNTLTRIQVILLPCPWVVSHSNLLKIAPWTALRVLIHTHSHLLESHFQWLFVRRPARARNRKWLTKCTHAFQFIFKSIVQLSISADSPAAPRPCQRIDTKPKINWKTQLLHCAIQKCTQKTKRIECFPGLGEVKNTKLFRF